MARTLLVFSIVTLMAPVAYGQTGDLGAQIAAKDAQLGSSSGKIYVTASGTVSEGKVSLSAGHDLVCSPGVTISLTSGSYLYQNSHTSIENCIISATSTPITGEIQSVNTEQIALQQVTFVGGGNLVFWSGVTGFQITNNDVMSITAVVTETQAPQAGYYLLNCSQGVVDNLKSNGFVFPAGVEFTGILQLNQSNNITINNPSIQNVDASYIHEGAAVIEINGSSNITVNGGTITNNANMDGILSEGYPTTGGPRVPSSYLSIEGLNSSYNGAVGLNQDAPLALGDGLDIINTSHVRVSQSTLDGNGNNVHDQQPGIWFFLDDDVEVSDSDISGNSAAGIASAGTPGVRLIRDTINRNSASGVYTEWQGCAATNVGSMVTFSSGVSGGFGIDWLPGTPIILDGVTYHLARVTDSGHLTLTTSPPNHSSPVSLGVNTTQNIRNSIINDNGVGQWAAQFGDQNQVGISWADGTNGTISDTTSTNTGIGSQLYGLELANTASVTLYDNDFSGNLLGGDGIAASPQGVSSTGLSFPDQELGTTSPTQTINFFTGMITAPDLVIRTSGNFSQTNNCGAYQAAYATCQIQVTFNPTFPGAQQGTLSITDTAPGSPVTIALTGTGTAASEGVSSSSVSFPAQLVGTSSPAQTITLWAGPTALYNLVIQTTGNFSGTNNCGGALAPDATCQIQITFHPTSLGTLHGMLNITHSGSSSVQAISLTGIGVNQNPGVSSSSVSFPDQQVSTSSMPQPVTLWAGAAGIQNLVIHTQGEFSETNNCGSGLAAFTTCQIQIMFTPSITGATHGTLTITGNPLQNLLMISLTGTGVPPGLALGIAAGSSNSVTVAAGGTAKYSLTIGGAGIGGMVSLSCVGLPTGAQCSLPATESVSASQAETFTVNVTTATETTAALRTSGVQRLSWLWGLAIWSVVMLPIRARTGRPTRRYSIRWLLLLWLLCACSGVSSSGGGTQPGTYKFNVMAKIGSTSQQVPLVLTVR